MNRLPKVSMILGQQNKLVLCVNADRLLAGFWRGCKLQTHQIFLNDETGHQAFSEFLAQFPEIPVLVIADAIEEDYRLESTPHVTGAAKRELIDRKLNQFYRGLEYRAAHFVNRETDKRKDDKFLFVALNNNEFLKDWVDLIQLAHVQLVGIYLLSMLSQSLVGKLNINSPHILLSEKLSSGFRQTYLHHGSIRMSRLVPIEPKVTTELTELNQYGYFYLNETEKTRLYLMSKRYIMRETPLDLLLISADEKFQEIISQGISQASGLMVSCVNINQLAFKHGLSMELLQKFPELLHMQLLVSGHSVDNLAPVTLTKHYRLNNIKRMIKLATLTFCLLGLSCLALLIKQGLDHSSEFNLALQNTLIQQQRYDEVAKSFPVTSLGSEDLKKAVELDQTISSFPKSPRRMMQVLSTALEKLPQKTSQQENFAQLKLDHVQLNRLHWLLTNDINFKDEDQIEGQISVQQPNNVEAEPNSQDVVDSTALKELAFINAEISGFKGDYRAAHHVVNRFVANLKADNRVATVDVLQAPVNLSSYLDLQGNTTDQQLSQKQPALFKLRVMLKAPEGIKVK